MNLLHVWHDPFIRLTWLIHMCDMTYLYTWHDSLTCMTWHIHTWDMTHSYVCHDAFIKPVSPETRAKSGKVHIFKPSTFKPLYQPYLGFWLFAWSRCGPTRKVNCRKDSWYQEYSESHPSAILGISSVLACRQHTHSCMSSTHCRHLCANLPKTCVRKLCLFWLKEPLITIQKSFCFRNFYWTWITFGCFENVCS